MGGICDNYKMALVNNNGISLRISWVNRKRIWGYWVLCNKKNTTKNPLLQPRTTTLQPLYNQNTTTKETRRE